MFTSNIECTRRLIEENNLRILEKYFGNRESLFLSSRESHSSFSYLSIKSLLEFEDEVTMSELESLYELLFL